MDGEEKEWTDLGNSSFGFATGTLVVPNFVVLVLLVIPIGEKLRRFHNIDVNLLIISFCLTC